MAQTVNLNNFEPLFHTILRATRPATSTSEPAPLSEETRSLVRAPSRMIRCSRKRRSSVNSCDWRPSLSSISEDNVAAMVVDRTAGIERSVKRKSGHDRTKVQVRSHDEDYGRASFAIPAFSPMPFMF